MTSNYFNSRVRIFSFALRTMNCTDHKTFSWIRVKFRQQTIRYGEFRQASGIQAVLKIRLACCSSLFKVLPPPPIHSRRMHAFTQEQTLNCPAIFDQLMDFYKIYRKIFTIIPMSGWLVGFTWWRVRFISPSVGFRNSQPSTDYGPVPEDGANFSLIFRFKNISNR